MHEVMYDLDVGQGVTIGKAGNIGHDPAACGVDTGHHPTILDLVRIPQQSFVVELTYPPNPRGSTGPVHPKARVIMPEISVRTFRRHPHLNLGEDDDSWACPLSPQAAGWNWGAGATLRYLDQVSIWIFKTVVWSATGRGALPTSKWLGPDTSHLPLDVLRAGGSEDPCRCGGGKSYGSCHLVADAFEAIMGGDVRLLTSAPGRD